MNPFDLEKKRAELSEQNKLNILSKTYDRSYPVIYDKNSAKFWDELNTECNDYTNNNNPMAIDRVRIVNKLIYGKNIKVLNIGFGSASLENNYFTNNQKITNVSWAGIDISHKSVNYAKKKYPYANFEVGNIRKLGFDNNIFDYVICLEVLEHIQPYHTFEALSELFRVIKKNGNLIVSVPLNEGLQMLISNNINPNGHVRVYTSSLIKAELKISGFNIFDEQYLYAFKKYYKLKKFIVTRFIKNYRKPNNIIIVARKP